MALSVDPKSVYNPPSSLRYPNMEEGQEQARADSPASTSSSHSDLSSPSFNKDLELEFAQKLSEAEQSDSVSSIGLKGVELFNLILY